jgi:hypothetical protein
MQLKGESNLTAFEDKATLIALAGHTRVLEGAAHVGFNVTLSGAGRRHRSRGRLAAWMINMMRGGSPNRSQKLMRLRVLLQFVAIIVIMATIWAMGH